VSEYRQDPVTGAWVIVAPERGRRPRQHLEAAAPTAIVPAFAPDCPFCPGNEHLLSGVVDVEPPGTGAAWRVRVIPNRYPAVRSDVGSDQPAPDAAASTSPAGGAVRPGWGHHEVIVESPRHDADLQTLSDPEMTAVLAVYRRRFVRLAAEPGMESVLVFKNHGPRAGASLQHPHAQVIATALMPPRLARAETWARERHRESDRCVTCAGLQAVLDAGERLVEATAEFVVLVPFAGVGSFETWIVPRRHQPSFAAVSDQALGDLGSCLRRLLARLRRVLGDVAYNFAIESAHPSKAGSPALHWRLRVMPGLTTEGGFELSAGLPIKSTRPEDEARRLADAAVAPAGPLQ
jgi:UDPglucose--hexose-1-phosphate uridylyltransferase